MISAKCFLNWFREAGRGHLIAAAGWGVFLAYGALAVSRVSFDPDYAAFGIGGPAMELRWICMALGLMTAFLEFSYLFSRKKQDFYYSLPSGRNVIFWSRYVHGIVHTIVPLTIVLAVCGICQAAIDSRFAPYAGGYTGKSILVYGLSLLLFYHIGVLCTVVCGHVVSALLTCAGLIVYGAVAAGQVCETLSESYFTSYYRNPLLEQAEIWLSPERLTCDLTGMDLFDKPSLLSYTPSVSSVAAAVLWIALLLLLSAAAWRYRKVEKTGNMFTLAAGERAVEILAGFLAGFWMFGFVTDLSDPRTMGAGTAAAVSAACSAAAVLAVHSLLEYIVNDQRKKMFRRKWQMILTGLAVVAAGAAFAAGAPAYDAYFPENAAGVGISIDGLDMSYARYADIRSGDQYSTEQQMEQYFLEGEGRTAALGWLREIVNSGCVETGDKAYTDMTVCYHMPDGSRHYRSYPLSREEVDMFAAVYETDEYKRAAYPGLLKEDAGKDRFTWENGVTGTALQITESQKEELLDAYREDVACLQMEQLRDTLPYGYVRIKSATDGAITDLYVYPFFEKTYGCLVKYGIDVEKGLADYTIELVEMIREYDVSGEGRAVSGGNYMSFYEGEDEISAVRQFLVPDELDIQPLLCPLDHSADVDAAVKDEETSSVVHVNCAQIYRQQ